MNPLFEDEGFQEIKRTTDEMLSETDRGCVLIGFELLNEGLLIALERKLEALAAEAKNNAGRDIKALLTRKPNPPLGSFYLRSLLAHSLGVISTPMRNALDQLREMRNKAAHATKPFSLNDYPLDALETAVDPGDLWFLSAKIMSASPARGRFITASMSLYWQIVSAVIPDVPRVGVIDMLRQVAKGELTPPGSTDDPEWASWRAVTAAVLQQMDRVNARHEKRNEAAREQDRRSGDAASGEANQ